MTRIKLSPSALNLFLDCQRCFWLEKVRFIKRPRGIFPSLPGGMDRSIKTYFDKYRAKKILPPELDRKEFEGITLFEGQEQLDKWRNWRTGLVYRNHDGSTLSGALDDLCVKEGQYIPFDYKTKGSPTTEEDATRYYQNQLDCYSLLLHENGFPVIGYGFLMYYSPKEVAERGVVKFALQTIKIMTSTERAKDNFLKAIALLGGATPEASDTCEYCLWFSNLKTL